MAHGLRASVAPYFATLGAFVAVDAAWLSLVGVEMFRSQLGPILRPQPLFMAAIAFYLIYAIGLMAFAVRPASDRGSLASAARLGGLLGFVAYSTFDLTNLAAISGWTTYLAVIDIAWGTVASAFAAFVGALIGSSINRVATVGRP